MDDIYKQFEEISRGMENLSKMILYKKIIENLQEEKEGSENAMMIDFSIGILEDAIKYRKKCELEGTAEDKWIPTSERLPEKTGRYLTYIINEYDNSIQFIMTCDYTNKIWTPDDECASDNVIAWMPLPERYEESEEVNGRGED